MKNDTFVLVSLEEEKAKKLGEVISNKTCRKILDYLGGKEEASESEIAKDLDLPISTVHYNLRLLLKNNLVSSKEFRWSEKGKEMNLYKIAKKLIIIAPKTSEGLKKQIKNIIPVALISVVASAIVYLFSKPKMLMQDAMLAGAERTTEELTTKVICGINALYFLYGALFAVILFLIFSLIRSRK